MIVDFDNYSTEKDINIKIHYQMILYMKINYSHQKMDLHHLKRN